jgi:hypothetical protein
MARIAKAVQEIRNILDTKDEVAAFVTNRYLSFRNNSQGQRNEARELRNYIFQTDTTKTTNKQLPWKNKTSIPKICQIRDNLHANYMAALFPHDDWFKWEAESQAGADRDTARSVEAYMKQKIRESGFKTTISECVLDYIDAGNAFGEVTYVVDQHKPEDGPGYTTYVGPKLERISPYDIQFDLSASSFKDAGKITRSLLSVGTLKYASENIPGYEWAQKAIDTAIRMRNELSSYGDSDLDKAEGLSVDGFGSMREYLSSGMIEVLEYEGDTYNSQTGDVSTNRRIIVVDRKHTVHDEPMDTWVGRSNKEHVGWRDRPDNLWSMSPLANLVGMQYRLDHLENLRADVFDQIAHPMFIVKGQAEDFESGPDERIYADVDADIDVIRPDTTALNADFQMDRLMQNMEDLAGAPRQAMGIRTPGEKTAFEVQSLENAAGRIFQQKIQHFEEMFVEPLLNQMLAAARKNVTAIELVKSTDDDFGVEEFLKVGPEELNKKGKLRPIGARHFSRQAQITQNLMGLANSAIYQDPAVSVHMSGKKIAELIEELLGLGKFDIVSDNVRITEQQETQSVATLAQQNVAEEVAGRQQVFNEAADQEEAALAEEL